MHIKRCHAYNSAHIGNYDDDISTHLCYSHFISLKEKEENFYFVKMKKLYIVFNCGIISPHLHFVDEGREECDHSTHIFCVGNSKKVVFGVVFPKNSLALKCLQYQQWE